MGPAGPLYVPIWLLLLQLEHEFDSGRHANMKILVSILVTVIHFGPPEFAIIRSCSLNSNV